MTVPVAGVQQSLSDAVEEVGGREISTPQKSVKDQMREFLSKGESADADGGEETSDGDPREEDDGSARADSADDGEEKQPGDDDESDGEKSDEQGEAKKPGRIARLRQRYESQIAEIQQTANKAQQDLHRAVYLANAWKMRAEQYQNTMAELSNRAKEHDLDIVDPRDQRMMMLEQKLQEMQLQSQFAQKWKQQEQAQQERQYVSQLKNQLISEATQAQNKFGVPAQEILAALSSYRQIPQYEGISIEAVARGLAALRAQNAGGNVASRQRAKNGVAPTPMSPGPANGLRLKATREDAARYLASIGGNSRG